MDDNIVSLKNVFYSESIAMARWHILPERRSGIKSHKSAEVQRKGRRRKNTEVVNEHKKGKTQITASQFCKETFISGLLLRLLPRTDFVRLKDLDKLFKSQQKRCLADQAVQANMSLTMVCFQIKIIRDKLVSRSIGLIRFIWIHTLNLIGYTIFSSLHCLLVV